MKKLKFIIILLFCTAFAYSQKSIKIYFGANYTTKQNVVFENKIKIDTLSFDHRWILLPQFGIDYNISISKKLILSTGIGLSFMGCKDFFIGMGTEKETSPILKKFFKDNPNLIINYLRIPIILKYQLKKGLNIYAGYAVNYSIRVNQAMLWNPSATEWKPNFYYKNYFHNGILGVEKNCGKFSFALNGILPITKIVDTGDYDPERTAYNKLYGFQMSVGYLIFE